jgi:glycosyltransferase involved in cell wall biosynthesis
MLRFGFVMEQTLGHVTHHQNLARWVAERPDIEPHWMPIAVTQTDLWQWMPVVRSNWSLKASLRTRDAVSRTLRSRRLDAVLYHTQTTALFSTGMMRRIPSVVSLDATPLNYDVVAEAYGHRSDNEGWLARRKYQWNRATFRNAAHLVTWCRWAKNSLVSDYGIPESRITVIPPGVDIDAWTNSERENGERNDSNFVRLLFVGGDFERKGGNLLVQAFRKGLQTGCELDIVTRDASAAAACAGLKGVRVHTGMTPNCHALMDLYRKADLFVFPTLGDCLPIAVMEAMAAGLPVIATSVGALDEEVEHGVNGLTVPPNQADAIVEAVRELRDNGARRQSMSRAGIEMARTRFNARKNYGALLDVMSGIAGQTTY